MRRLRECADQGLCGRWLSPDKLFARPAGFGRSGEPRFIGVPSEAVEPGRPAAEALLAYGKGSVAEIGVRVADLREVIQAMVPILQELSETLAGEPFIVRGPGNDNAGSGAPE